VHEIKRPLRKRVGTHVVTEHLHVRGADRAEEVGLEVGRGHPTVRADPVGKPTRDGATAAPDLQAPCASAEAEPLETPDRQGIKTFLEQLEAAQLVLGGMRKRVVRGFGHTVDSRPSPIHRPGSLWVALPSSS
jgi:hypothetical protein